MASQRHEGDVTRRFQCVVPGQRCTGWARVLIASAVPLVVAAVAWLLFYCAFYFSYGLAPLGFVLVGAPMAACGLLYLAGVRPAFPVALAGAVAVFVLGWVYINSSLSDVLGLPGVGTVLSVSYGAAAALTAPDARIRLRIGVVIGFVAIVALVAMGPPIQEQWVG